MTCCMVDEKNELPAQVLGLREREHNEEFMSNTSKPR